MELRINRVRINRSQPVVTKADFQIQNQGKIFEVKPTEQFVTNHPNLITLPIVH